MSIFKLGPKRSNAESLPRGRSINSFEEISTAINTLTQGSKIWGLSWMVHAKVSWSIWRESNARVKRGKTAPKEVILYTATQTARTSLKESRYKKAHQSHDKAQAFQDWMDRVNAGCHGQTESAICLSGYPNHHCRHF